MIGDYSLPAPAVSLMYSLLLLDTGETVSASVLQLAPCPPGLLSKLPLQAVPCSLHGIAPAKGESWSQEAGDALFEATRETDSDAPLILQCTVAGLEDGCYDVHLVTPDEEDLGEVLVSQGFAVFKRESRTDEESPSPEVSESELDDEESIMEHESSNENVEGWDNTFQQSGGLHLKDLEVMLGERGPPMELKPSETNKMKVVTSSNGHQKISLKSENVSITLVRNLSSYETTVPSLVWTQTRAELIIKAFNNSLNDFGPGQVFLKVTPETLVLQILGFEIEKQLESYKIYETPVLELYDRVQPSASSVVVKPRMVKVVLAKRRRSLWPKLATHKYAWLRRDSELGSFSDSEGETENQPDIKEEAAFASTALNGDKHYHKETGVEVLPEFLFDANCQSSDSEGEVEAGQFDFIHDDALEVSPDAVM